MESNTLKEIIKAEADSLGFCLCGFTTPEELGNFDIYQNWLAVGFHAEMNYLTSESHKIKRKNPMLLMPSVRSIVSLGIQYPLHLKNKLLDKESYLVAGYVTQDDYHDSIPTLLLELVERVKSHSTANFNSMIFTDSAPILERELAQRAGLGWIGKNSCLISPKFGSNILLSEIFLDIEIEPDPPFINDRCGTCMNCIKSCPTQCIQSNRTIDSRKCISYLTIENRHSVSKGMYQHFGNWIFGCDICQMVCPWNQRSEVLDLKPISFSELDLISFLKLSPQEFITRFGTTAISRVKWNGFIRNILLCLYSTGSCTLLQPIHDLESQTTDPLILDTIKLIKQGLLK